MNRLKYSFILILFTLTGFINAQNIDYVKDMVVVLSSGKMQGRGYVNKGDSLAADFIAMQMRNSGLTPFGDSYFQPYTLSMNTFPGSVRLSIGATVLNPGTDYVINCSSKSTENTFKVLRITKKQIAKKKFLKKLGRKNLSNTLLLLDGKGIEDKEQKELLRYLHQANPVKAGAVFMLVDSNIIWSVSDCRNTNDFVRGSILRSVAEDAGFISISFQSQYIRNYTTQNVAGYVRGIEKPDSFILFMAHYDHLGRMGDKTLFPGANDNASGTATVLDLAKYYTSTNAKNRYSIAFILYSGEEAGLLGSTFFANNPLMPLDKIRFAVNLDMVGTGSEGISVINGSINTAEFAILKSLNDSCECLPEISGRGESSNSDHYPLHAKGVKTFFIFTRGKEHRHYHNPNDLVATLPFTGYDGLFRLLTDFAEKLQTNE